MARKHRNFLFLQGPNSFFFKELGKELKNNGHSVKKINFCGGDKFFWNDEDCINFTDKIDEWQNFLKDLDKKDSYTDIMLYGDCREYHKTAIKLFKDKKIHVFEEGYFRPNWITYELDGVNAYSKLPTEAGFYNNLKEKYDHENFDFVEMGATLRYKAAYTCTHYIYRSFYDEKEFPNYIPHRSVTPEEEGGAWFRKWLKSGCKKIKANIIQRRVLEDKRPFFLFALQLCSDSQISEHSDFSGMRDAIEFVLRNFAKNAPKEIFMVIKTHPEEPGISKLHIKVSELTKELNIEKRVVFIDGGNMPEFLKAMKGMVTINSTATLSALHHRKPVKCLGRAVYNFAGLTDQQDLKDFWKKPEKADPDLFDKYRKYVHDETQINGNFYSKKGINILIQNLIPKI